MPMRVPRHLREHHSEPGTDREMYLRYALRADPPVCECGCGQEAPWRNWREGFSRFVNGHNGRLGSMPKHEADRIKQARSSTLSEGISSGRVIPWSRGRTGDNDARVARRNQRISAGHKVRVAEGTRSWSLGLTKEDPRIARAADSLRLSYQTGKTVQWSFGRTKETDDRVMRMSLRVSESKLLSSQAISASRMLPWEAVLSRASCAGLDVVSGPESYTGVAERTVAVQCRKCSVMRVTSLYQISCNPCPTCRPVSSPQEEISEYIRSLGEQCWSDRVAIAPKEIDVFVPRASFGVEHHGLYWHTERRSGKRSHAEKQVACQVKGIRLLQVFSDEWRDKKEVIMSMICARLGRPSRRVGARKCIIEELEPRERRDFFSRCHLEGDAAASRSWCLRLEGQVVAAISVRRPKVKMRRNDLEIARFACDLNTSVPGGLSRLMSRVIAHARSLGIKQIMTYVDTRVGDGHGYAACGMHLTGRTSPRFWWTDMNRRYDRFKFRADRALGLSEADVANKAGVEKIWGCQNLIYALEIS